MEHYLPRIKHREGHSVGAIADFFVAYAQPLLDITDGSHEEMQQALGLAQVCYNLSLLPRDEREKFILRMQDDLGMDDAEFAEFRRGLIDPMVERNHRATANALVSMSANHRSGVEDDRPAPRLKSTVNRYAPCPCQSGKKYKFCCGAK
jgi:hypothetical protein